MEAWTSTSLRRLKSCHPGEAVCWVEISSELSMLYMCPHVSLILCTTEHNVWQYRAGRVETSILLCLKPGIGSFELQ